MDSRQSYHANHTFSPTMLDLPEVNCRWSDDMNPCASSEQVHPQSHDHWVNDVETLHTLQDTSASGASFPTSFGSDLVTQYGTELWPSNNQPVSLESLAKMTDVPWTWNHVDPSESVETPRGPFALPHEVEDLVEESSASMSACTSEQGNNSVAISIGNQDSEKPDDVLHTTPEHFGIKDLPSKVISVRTSSSTSATAKCTAVLDDSFAAIGTVLKNGKFRCNRKECACLTFNRHAEFKRHYATTHAAQKPVFWCCVESCERSEGPGSKSFPRKDKLDDHIRKVHNMKRLEGESGGYT